MNMDSGQVNGAFPKEIPFEIEYENARIAAEDFTVGQRGSFRTSITLACRSAFEGVRSIEGFVKFATALIEDKSGHFQTPLLSVQTLFLNSLKYEDVDLEILRETMDKNADIAQEYNRKNQNLIKMINGLVVIY